MRPHQWTFLAVPDATPPIQGSTSRVIGVCRACGLTRVLTIDGDRDRHFDLSGDCRTAGERSEDQRLGQGAGR